MREWFEEEAGRGRDVWFERGRRGWMEFSGGKREKPQRNKRPSGLIRRQIGCRVQWREKRERDIM